MGVALSECKYLNLERSLQRVREMIKDLVVFLLFVFVCFWSSATSCSSLSSLAPSVRLFISEWRSLCLPFLLLSRLLSPALLPCHPFCLFLNPPLSSPLYPSIHASIHSTQPILLSSPPPSFLPHSSSSLLGWYLIDPHAFCH